MTDPESIFFQIQNNKRTVSKNPKNADDAMPPMATFLMKTAERH
jgi:hypothetical protein